MSWAAYGKLIILRSCWHASADWARVSYIMSGSQQMSGSLSVSVRWGILVEGLAECVIVWGDSSAAPCQQCRKLSQVKTKVNKWKIKWTSRHTREKVCSPGDTPVVLNVTSLTRPPELPHLFSTWAATRQVQVLACYLRRDFLRWVRD